MLLPGRFLRAEGERARGERKGWRGVIAREEGRLEMLCTSHEAGRGSQAARHKSQVTGRKSQVTSHKSQVTSHK